MSNEAYIEKLERRFCELKIQLRQTEENVVECHTIISRKNTEIDELWKTIRELTRREGMYLFDDVNP